MNKEPKPEKQKPLKDRCDNCDKTYSITKANAGGMEYSEKPECNFLLCKCPHCESVTYIFIPETSNTLQRARQHDIEIFQATWPSDEIYKTWCEAYGIELLEPTALTERQERIVAYLGYILDNDIISREEWEREGDVWL